MVLLCGSPKTILFGCEPFCCCLLPCRGLFSAVQFGFVLKHHCSRKTQGRDLCSAWSPRWFLPKKKRTVWTKGRNYCLDKVAWQVNRSSGWVSIPNGSAPSMESWAPLSAPCTVKSPWNGWCRTGQLTALCSPKGTEQYKLNRQLIDWTS